MLKFSDLSKSQKKCVVALVDANPSLKSVAQITLKEVVAITQSLAAKRTDGAPKIGYPNWLFKHNKVDRGVYQLPVPSEQELADFMASFTQGAAAQPKAKVTQVAKTKAAVATRLEKIVEESPVHDQDVEEFNQILRENGIEV
jgi:hypothetical protein